MITKGFVCSWSGVLTIDTPIAFPAASQVKYSTYLIVDTTGGDIVYVNPIGVTCVWPAATPGINLIAATEVLSGATIDGQAYTTAADVVGWAGDSPY